MTEPDFWNDNIAAQKTSQELNELKMKYETFNNMQELSDETELYLEMLEEDDSVQEELEETLEKLDKIMTSYEMTLLLSEPYDHNNAILEIHPGSGGTEAQDWLICYSVCINVMEMPKVSRLRLWNIRLVMKLESNL
mgnify:CR=1 FL=1